MNYFLNTPNFSLRLAFLCFLSALDNLIYSNQYDFANDTWRFPDSSFIPEITEDSGSNYFDRADQMLHFVIGMCSKSCSSCLRNYDLTYGARCAVKRNVDVT